MLTELMKADLESGAIPEGVDLLVSKILEKHDQGSIRAILFYGSCRRNLEPGEGLVDLLVVTHRYRDFHGTGPGALANWLLPPNVYFLQTESARGIYRCKYAVVSWPAFKNRTRRGRDGYFWARFTQPCRIGWARDEQTRMEIARARSEAARRFTGKAASLLPGRWTPELFWSQALAASYRCELRPEPPESAARLVERDSAFYQAMTPLALSGHEWVDMEPSNQGSDTGQDVVSRPGALRHTASRLDWAARRVWGKTLNLARLFKAAGTFTNGIDYLVWKVERHSGVRIEPTDTMRRYPRLAAWGLAWKMWRMGAFR